MTTLKTTYVMSFHVHADSSWTHLWSVTITFCVLTRGPMAYRPNSRAGKGTRKRGPVIDHIVTLGASRRSGLRQSATVNRPWAALGPSASPGGG